MRFIKKIFEDIKLNPAFGEGVIPFIRGVQLDYLPPAQLQMAIEKFEDLLMLVYPFIDKGLEIKFEIAYGQRCLMTYEDYQNKNNKWVEFINAYFKSRKIVVIVDFDKIDLLLLSNIILTEYNDFLKKISLYKLKHRCTDISMNEKYDLAVPMRLEIELDKI